jgi:cell wall-associated NlpC family hydrolase
MINESGLFDGPVVTALDTFRASFLIKNNEVAQGSYQKLQKDYGFDATAMVNKIIDKETLVGEAQLATDMEINDGDAITDTGLYELYGNVVEPFVDGMIAEAERYAGLDSAAVGERPMDEWTSRGSSASNGYGPTDCVVGTGCAGSHGAGMSYSYGGKQTVKDFNDTVSVFKAPPNAQYNSLSLAGSYKGNLYPAGATNAAGDSVEGKIGATTDKKMWPGLYQKNEYTIDSTSPYYVKNWAGIDCIGLVQRVLQTSEAAMKAAGYDQLSFVKGSINTTGGIAPITDERQIAWGIGAHGLYAEGEAAYKAITPVQLIKQGDVVFYGNTEGNGTVKITHISIVYSDRWGDVDVSGKNYDVIHAFGYEKSNNPEKNLIYPWHRKVGVTGNEHPGLGAPNGFGRIKLWE